MIPPQKKKNELLYLPTIKNSYLYYRAQLLIILLRSAEYKIPLHSLLFRNFPLIETNETGTLANRVSTTNETLPEATAPHFPSVDPPGRPQQGTSRSSYYLNVSGLPRKS